MVDYSLKHISGPATEPVTLAQLKLQAELDPTDTSKDELLTLDLQSARRDAENTLGYKIGTQVWDIYLDSWPAYVRWILPIEPLISVDEIEYRDSDGNLATVAETVWAYSAARGSLWLQYGQTWPTVELDAYSAVRVRVTVGLQPVSDGNSPVTLQYPANIRKAILLRASTYYRLREDVMLGGALAPNEVKAFQSLLGAERILIV